MRFLRPKSFIVPLLTLASLFTTAAAGTVPNAAFVERTSGLAVIKGMVRDSGGSPIADATVAIFRVGTSKLLKQVRSAADGSFLAKIVPGTYKVLAVAEGFNPVTLAEIQVDGSAPLNYGFKLERAGSGNTLPEKRLDRNNPKWLIRSAQTSRSIYQNREGEDIATDADKNGSVEVLESPELPDNPAKRRGQTVVETYFAGTAGGLNIATLLPVNERTEFILAGQTGVGKNAPQRVETQFRFRPSGKHQLRMTAAYSNFGGIIANNREETLSQVSFQALDEWKVREGVILVFGLDYSKFVGAGDDSSISPRLGFQLDLDPKTRFRTAYTVQPDSRSWAKAIELEDAQVVFREPAEIRDLVIENGKPKLNRSSRLEFGIERVLDNRSSVEATAFFDTSINRGVGLTAIPFDSLDPSEFNEITGDQHGAARGLRLVYNRRLSSKISTAAGYSFGTGQKLSDNNWAEPSGLFQNAAFQSFFGQVEADLTTGTNVKTIFRLSPQATVFAIDPFQGRLAIYDPSLSVLVTQNLPNLGLPFRAEAIVDARNLFDFQTGILGETRSLQLNSQRRMVRGGILVRF